MPRHHCFKCGHEWIPRNPRRPALCPKCGYTRWDDPDAVPNPVPITSAVPTNEGSDLSGTVPRKIGASLDTCDAVQISSSAGSQIQTSPGEDPWVILFLNILRSGTVASRGIKWNVMMVAKAMGLPFESPTLIPAASDELERAARDEIAVAERLIAQSEQVAALHRKPRRRDRRTGSGN